LKKAKSAKGIMGWAAELRTQVYISQEVNIFSELDAKELIQELRSISKMLQSLHSSLGQL
jgi:four helix bundle protein